MNNVFGILKILFINLFIILTCLCIIELKLSGGEYNKPYWLDTAHMERGDNNLPYDKNKKSIITIGCSFTYGSGLEENETFAYKLAQKTNRKVYNRGIPGHGPQHLLWQLQTYDFFNKNEIVEPEYFIYTFISDHIRRMYAHRFAYPPENAYIFDMYKVKNGKLIPRKKGEILFRDYFYNTALSKKFNFFMYKIKSDDEKFDLLKLYLTETKKELAKKYKDVKFVIIVYNPDCDTIQTHNSLPFKTNRWDELEKDGFIIIRFDSPEYDFLNTQEYLVSDNVHPSEKAWDKLVPIIAEKLEI